MTRSILTLACLTLLGCAETATPAPAADPPDATASAPRMVTVAPVAAKEVVAPVPGAAAPFLVWGTDTDGLTYSFWLSPTPNGFDAVEATGVVVAADGALFHWVVEEESVPTELDCEELETIPGRGTGTGVSAFLDRVGGGERRDLFSPRALEAREASDWEENATLRGSLGPYLFVERSMYSYHCGAHGGSQHEFFVIDARTGNPVEMYAQDELPALDSGMAGRARAALVEATDGESLLFGDEVSYTLSVPVLGAGGVRLSHQWTAGTCYACSDGAWDSYTVSTQIETDALPAILAAHAAGAAEVVRFVASEYEGITVHGVSRPDPSLRAAFEELPFEGC